MVSVADDYTEFNPDYPRRIDGKAKAARMTEVVPDDKSMFADIASGNLSRPGKVHSATGSRLCFSDPVENSRSSCHPKLDERTSALLERKSRVE